MAADLTDSDPTINESPYSRLIALAMSCLFFIVPVAGLQRISVGRIKSGILWMVTFGLLGIGQIYDTIMIALGQFRDVDGKRVLHFTKKKVQALKEPVNQYSAVARRQWTDSRVGFKLGNLVFNMFGGILLLIALAAGLLVSTDIPAGIAAGAFGAEVRDEFVRNTMMTDWNLIATTGIGMITLVAGMLSAICLICARRESTWSHMFRIPLAAAAFTGSLMCVGSIVGHGDNWSRIGSLVMDRQVGAAFRRLLDNGFWPGMIFAAILFVVAVFTLAWPAKRRKAVDEVRVDVDVPQREKQVV